MKLVAVLKWTGCACGMIGALIQALHIPISGWGWVFYTANSLFWLVASIQMRERSLIVQSIVYTILNVVGIYRWLF